MQTITHNYHNGTYLQPLFTNFIGCQHSRQFKIGLKIFDAHAPILGYCVKKWVELQLV